MKKLEKIEEIYNNKELKEMAIEQQERWLRAKIVMQFVFLREKLGYTQQEIADKMGVMRQQITRFENMSNSPTIFFSQIRKCTRYRIRCYFEWSRIN